MISKQYGLHLILKDRIYKFIDQMVQERIKIGLQIRNKNFFYTTSSLTNKSTNCSVFSFFSEVD